MPSVLLRLRSQDRYTNPADRVSAHRPWWIDFSSPLDRELGSSVPVPLRYQKQHDPVGEKDVSKRDCTRSSTRPRGERDVFSPRARRLVAQVDSLVARPVQVNIRWELRWITFGVVFSIQRSPSLRWGALRSWYWAYGYLQYSQRPQFWLDLRQCREMRPRSSWQGFARGHFSIVLRDISPLGNGSKGKEAIAPIAAARR